MDVFTVQPILSPAPFEVLCTMKWGGRTLILQRNNEPLLFQKSWNAYKNGFGFMGWPGDFWLGNEKIHYLTASRPHRLLVLLWVGSHYQRINYLGFVVGNENQNFKMNFDTVKLASKSKQHLDDCLSPLRNASFSTPDADHDGDSDVDCAGLSNSGWWFRGPDCSECNLNGIMRTSDDPITFADVHWPPDDSRITKMFVSLIRM